MVGIGHCTGPSRGYALRDSRSLVSDRMAVMKLDGNLCIGAYLVNPSRRFVNKVFSFSMLVFVQPIGQGSKNLNDALSSSQLVIDAVVGHGGVVLRL